MGQQNPAPGFLGGKHPIIYSLSNAFYHPRWFIGFRNNHPLPQIRPLITTRTTRQVTAQAAAEYSRAFSLLR